MRILKKNVKFIKNEKDLVTFSVIGLKKFDNSVHNIIQHNLECSFAQGDYWDNWQNLKEIYTGDGYHVINSLLDGSGRKSSLYCTSNFFHKVEIISK